MNKVGVVNKVRAMNDEETTDFVFNDLSEMPLVSIFEYNKYNK